MTVREAYLESVAVAIETIALPVVASAWLRDSALAGWPVATLSGHLGAGTTATVLRYLDAEPLAPHTSTVDPVAYFVGAAKMIEANPSFEAGITERAEAAAVGGQAGVVERAEHALDLLGERLAAEPPERAMSVIGGVPMTLDDYLVTRLLELCVHLDDLAVSVAIATPELPHEAMSLAVSTLAGVSLRRRGALAVMRALSRPERQSEPVSAF